MENRSRACTFARMIDTPRSMDWVLIVEVTATAHKGWRLEEDLGKRFAVEVEQYLAVWVVPLMAVRLQLGHIYSEQSGHEMEEQ